MSKRSRIAIFASGGGTNAEAIVEYFKDHPAITVVLLVSNNPEAYVLTRAKKFSISTALIDKASFKDADVTLEMLRTHQVTHIVLAGFLWLIPAYLIHAFPGRIINIHPALLPKFGGKGMYGMRVHEAVKSANEKETGITIHLVDEQYDEGKVVFQATCPVAPTDSPKEIAENVHRLEYANYPNVIEAWILKA